MNIPLTAVQPDGQPSLVTPLDSFTEPSRSTCIPGYVTASLVVSIGGFLNGYDTGSIGGVISMTQFHETFGELSSFMVGFTVSLILLAGILPAVLAGQLADRFGRLHAISIGAIFFAIGAILEAGAPKLSMFLVGRALCGVGQSLWLSNSVVYISEIAPSKHRGALVCIAQLITASAICLGYFTCYGSEKIGSTWAWRVPFVIMATASAILALSAQVIPQSPRWLMHNGHRDKAEKELQRLGVSRAEAVRDILVISTSVQSSLTFRNGLNMIFRRPYRRRTLLAFFILGMLQLAGIDGILYYAPTLFREAGLSSQSASFLASGVSAILMLVVSVPGFLFVDKWGRRTAILSGGLMLSFCMLLIGSLYASDSVHSYGAARWVVVVAIFVFAMTYCATWNMVGKLYAAEIQPAHTRASANSVGLGLNCFANWIVAIATPILLANSSSSAYFLYGGLAFATVVVLWAYMPETRGRSLESIQEQFQQPILRSFTDHLRGLASITQLFRARSE